MITRQQLQLINRKRLNYPLDIAEKDYFLALALQGLSSSPLGGTLVFKGGTALHHCYLSQHRFSEDLDFTSLDHDLTLATVRAVLTTGTVFQIRKEYESPATVKIERLWYPGILDQPGAVKIEIDRAQNVVLPAKQVAYSNVWGLDFTVQVMDIREICAEKIRATSQRARYRDFYDLFLIFDSFSPDLSEIADLIRQKEVRAPISPQAMQANWQIASLGQADDLRAIFCTRDVGNAGIRALLDTIHFTPIWPEA